MTDYVQGGIFGGMNFAPIDFNPTFGSTPAAPSFGLDDGAKAISSASTSLNNVSPASNFPAATSVAAPSLGTSGASKTSGSVVADFFSRAVVIILGFIFVAVGLLMFKPAQQIISNTASKVTP